jgi:hypothetical protein
MRQTLLFGLFLGILSVHPLRATNPDDIDFRLCPVKDSYSYHIGEPIEFEVLYSSESQKKYQGSWTTPRPELQAVTLQISPAEGVVDLRVLRQSMGFAGSILSSIGYLGSEPYKQKLEITDWYRFQKPGRYALTVTSNSVWRVKSADEGGSKEPVTLSSNIAEFEILPADPSWESQEISDASHDLDAASDDNRRSRAVRRLALLDTPSAVRNLVEQYLSSSDGNNSYEVYRALAESSQIDLIVPMIEAALSNPTLNPPSQATELIAELRVRQQLDMLPAYPADREAQKDWEGQSEKRRQLHNAYLAQANAALLASLGRRSGTERTQTIYALWDSAERESAAMPLSSEMLDQLRYELVNSAEFLSSGQKMQFVSLAWNHMPHDQLLPIIRDLASAEQETDFAYRHAAFELWCQGWPADCNSAILSAALKPGKHIDRNVVLLLKESEHPELDKSLEQQLKTASVLQDSLESQRIAALVLRVGSRNLRKAVDVFLDQFAVKPSYACEIYGYLVGYLFRFAPDDAGKRVTTELRGTDDPCGSQLFRVLNMSRYSDELIPVAIQAINSPNVLAAGSAALFLAERGPSSSREIVWRRLDVFWRVWRNRAAELRVTTDGDDVRAHNANFEQQLVSALAHANHWKLSQTDRDHLRDSCITEQCREVADGKMFFNL